jgi:hypothetical protein
MLPSNMLLLNLTPLIDVTFSTPTPDSVNYPAIRLHFLDLRLDYMRVEPSSFTTNAVTDITDKPALLM